MIDLSLERRQANHLFYLFIVEPLERRQANHLFYLFIVEPLER
jgi:hypothetical protein